MISDDLLIDDDDLEDNISDITGKIDDLEDITVNDLEIDDVNINIDDLEDMETLKVNMPEKKPKSSRKASTASWMEGRGLFIAPDL